MVKFYTIDNRDGLCVSLSWKGEVVNMPKVCGTKLFACRTHIMYKNYWGGWGNIKQISAELSMAVLYTYYIQKSDSCTRGTQFTTKMFT